MTKWTINEKKENVYLFHSIIFAPLLFYVAYKGNKSSESAFIALLLFGIIGFLYHSSVLFFIHYNDYADNEPDYKIIMTFVYLFHILFVMPIFIYAGYYGINSKEFIYPILGTLGFMTMAYHGSFYVYLKLIKTPSKKN